MMTLKTLVRTFAMALTLALVSPLSIGAQQPPPQDAKDEYVPLDQTQPQSVEQLPAAPLVAAAYGVAWLGVLIYVWSIWNRLQRVDRELTDVARRLDPGARR